MDKNIMTDIVRVGIVTDIDAGKRLARVHFPALGIPSGWLFVIQHYQADIYVDPDNEHNHVIHDTYTGGGGSENIPDHNHPGTHLTYWMPRINDKVLVLYIPIFNGDGFILGGI